MCGIFLCLSENEELAEHYLQVLEPLLKNRGPDHVNKIRLELELSCDKKIYVTFLGCVLWLQGSQLTTQPVTDSDENILLWNGDIFGGQVEDGLSDTIVLSRRLQSLSDDEVPKEMSELQGPFAFAYLRGKTGKIWFGRDFFGRHSLLMETGLDRLVLSSIGHKAFKSLVEVPAAGIFVSEISRCFDAGFRVHPWSERSFDLDANFEVLEPIASSVRKMKCFEEITDEPQDLNESHGSSVNDKTTSHLSELERLFNSDASYQRLINDLLLVMMSSVQKRLSSMPKFCKNCVKTETVCSHSKIGVLFSGGLDSSVLAVLADQLLDQGESIDLLNVAFEQPNGSYNVPDRQTAIKAVKELAIINPQRKYNLVLINVSKDELAVNREQKIVHLLFPLTTVLDDSIGCAIWFAARGQGQIMDETGSAFVETYQSPVRVLLLGAGADEQFGGYSRHRVRFQQSGLSGLHDEIRLEMNRISERNLGRDNRIVSDHGVEGRYPFLDESVVSYLNSLKVNEKCDLRLPRGLGEKLLLRLLAFKLGLRQVAVEPKRAIQFGSRIARMENRKEKATDQALRSS